MKHILFLLVLLAFALFVFCMAFAGCTSHPIQTTNANATVRHTSDIDKLKAMIPSVSKGGTFPNIVESLHKSMHNPDRFEFIKAEYLLREKSTKRPSATHITYYYLIRIHFRGENAFGALRLSHQDFALYPDGNIRALPKKGK